MDTTNNEKTHRLGEYDAIIEVSKEVIKILVEKKVICTDWVSADFSKEFYNLIFKSIPIATSNKNLKIKTLDDVILQSTNTAVLFWNHDLGLKLSDAEYNEECMTCCTLIQVKYLDSIKNKIKQDRKLCEMLEKDGIKIS